MLNMIIFQQKSNNNEKIKIKEEPYLTTFVEANCLATRREREREVGEKIRKSTGFSLQ